MIRNGLLLPVNDPAFFRETVNQRIHFLMVPAVAHLVALPVFVLLWWRADQGSVYADGDALVYWLIRVVVVVLATLILIYSGIHRRHPLTNRAEDWFLRVMGFGIVATTAAEAVLNMSHGGDPTAYQFAALGAAILLWEPTWAMTALYVTGAVTMSVFAIIFSASVGDATPQVVQVVVSSIFAWAISIGTTRNRYLMWRQDRDLREAQEVKDAILTAIGHDLRVPFAQLRNVARFLEAPDQRFAERRSAIVAELNRTIRSAELTMDNLTGIGTERAAQKDIRSVRSTTDLCHEAIAVMEPIAEAKDMSIAYHGEDDVLVRADRGMIVTVLRNLMHNAVKFSPEGSVVQVATRVHPDHAELSVTDAGIGVSPDVAAAIEQGAARLPVRSHGTHGERGNGLGLRVCRVFLNAHGSELKVSSGARGGTVVSFYLRRWREHG